MLTGPPGTGKTTALFREVHDCLARGEARRVMVTSMTRAAAAEVRGRMDSGFTSLLQEKQVGTLHSMARKALGSSATPISERGRHPKKTENPSGRDSWNAKYPHYALSRLYRGDYDDSAPIEPTEGDRLYQTWHLLRALMTPEEKWPKDVKAFGESWTGWKEERGVCDFDDWIVECLERGVLPADRPEAIWVDEAQDQTPLEIELLRRWGESCPRGLTWVGDPDQCLYYFRGARPGLLAINQWQDDHEVLSRSWRCPKRVHAMSTSVLAQISDRVPIEYAPRDADGVCEQIGYTYRDGDHLVDEALEHEKAGQSVLFLGACQYQLGWIITALRRRGVPYGNPYTERTYLNAWGAPGMKAARAYYRACADAWKTRARPWHWEELWEWTQYLAGLPYGRKKIIRANAEDPRERSEEVWSSVEEAVDGVDTWFKNETTLFWGLERVKRRLIKSRAGILDYAYALEQRRGPMALNVPPKVMVGTIHSVKGGEADHVYLFPDLGSKFYAEYEAGGERRDAVLRMIYVGMTRAREGLHLCDPEEETYYVWP